MTTNVVMQDLSQTHLRQYDKNHPMRIKRGKDRGRLPHELESKKSWEKWMILAGMSESAYWKNVQNGEHYATKKTTDFKRIKTNKLTPDQRGWAKLDHPDSFNITESVWLIDPQKPSRPIPDTEFKIERDISYPKGCGHDADFTMWGKTYNNIMLVKCTECGKIFAGG